MTDLTAKQKNILSELESARKAIKTDDYSMSIGELINIYRDGEIKLDPAFQRLFRWKDRQKTKLIESILIGIPIPEIFVAQKLDGTWHVVDGVQRLSTIYQLVGDLEDKDPLVLTTCKYIPSLEHATWDSLPISTQREFKKSKIKINIILTENSDEAQFELFQRLNTGGTALEDQEVRNCLILMVSPDFYEKLNNLKEYANFKSCLRMKEHNFHKEFHMELILRMFMGYQNIIDYSSYEPLSTTLLSEFIDKETINLIQNSDFDIFSSIFKRTFDKLNSTLSDEAFLKYSKEQDVFSGAFNVSVFEMISTGVSTNIDAIEGEGDEELVSKIKSLYEEEVVNQLLLRGVKAIQRFKGLTEYSRTYFQ
jgi:uncharacterized protein with ParB-like and HNH nuclease domain